jgi:hypothetical protein
LRFLKISIEDVAAILDTYCQALWSLDLEIFYDEGPDRNIILSRPTALRELSIESDELALFTYSLVSQSPDLTRLRLPSFDFDTSDEVTNCVGEKLEHLDLDIIEKLPRLGCVNLKSLYLHIEYYDEDTLEDGEAGDLSNIKCLMIATEMGELSQDQAISVMRCYDIGRNLEGLVLSSNLEPVRIYGGDICSRAPILRTLTTLVGEAFLSDSELMREVVSYETIRELEARGITVTVTTQKNFDFTTCRTCKEVHLGSIAFNELPLTSYLDGARSLN